jgi:tetratricopeptide (TPR) repeat protein
VGTTLPHDRPSPRDGGPPDQRPADANPALQPDTQARAQNLETHPLRVALRLLQADAPGEIMSAPESWPRWAALLPHVLAATACLDPALASDTAVLEEAAWLLNGAGTYLQVHARLNEARPLLERALAITEAAHGPDHPDVAACLNNLATALQDLGQPQDAQPLLERALAIDEAAYGPGHPEVATDLSNLGQALLDLGQPQDARPLLERALAIDEAAYGPGHPAVATDLSNLAILRDLGQPQDAHQAPQEKTQGKELRGRSAA